MNLSTITRLLCIKCLQACFRCHYKRISLYFYTNFVRSVYSGRRRYLHFRSIWPYGHTIFEYEVEYELRMHSQNSFNQNTLYIIRNIVLIGRFSSMNMKIVLLNFYDRKAKIAKYNLLYNCAWVEKLNICCLSPFIKIATNSILQMF
jgi:hypothetical protein